jgi:hypothetical protein
MGGMDQTITLSMPVAIGASALLIVLGGIVGAVSALRAANRILRER